jgi:glycerol uptake facilitator protein
VQRQYQADFVSEWRQKMTASMAEFLGTLILVLLGNGVVANVVLAKTKGNQAGWIVISVGWSIAVFVGALCSAKASGAHLNPAVTIAMAMSGKLPSQDVTSYLMAQMAGAVVGGILVYLFYRDHFTATDDADAKLACFCTAPNIRGSWQSLFCEVIGTFVLILPVFLVESPLVENLTGTDPSKPPVLGMGTLGLLPVALIVLGIGLSLGGTTGYAINPARDLGPRIAHFLLPIPGKRDSDWSYAWIPVVGPILGALLAVLVFQSIT